MMTLKPSLTYLTRYLKKDFNLFSRNIDALMEEEISDLKELTDREKGILIFENFISDSFFINPTNLHEFISSLHEEVQKKILIDLGKSQITDLVWSLSVSKYFIEVYNFNPKFLVKEEDPLLIESYRSFQKFPHDFKKLKEFQANIFFKTYRYLSTTPFARCIIQMPTGSGKTRTAMEIVTEFLNDNYGDVLWLANTEELCDQAFDAFVEVSTFLRRRDVQVINHMRSTQNIEHNMPCFHIASIQSLLNKSKSEIKDRLQVEIRFIQLLIVDEAHISIAKEYRKIIEQFIENGTKLIGLTATPGRELKKKFKTDQNLILSEFYNNKKFEIEMKATTPLSYLRDEGILSYTHFQSIEGSYIEDSLKQKSQTISDYDVIKKIEKVLTEDTSRNMVILKQLIKLLNEGKKIVFFATSVIHSKLINTLLEYKGYATAHLDGNTGKERNAIIANFKKGKIQIICNYSILSTGFDDPKIDVVFIARITDSIVLYSQMIGRGLRGPLIGGTEKCEIFTVVDNIIDLPDNDQIYSYFNNYFEN